MATTAPSPAAGVDVVSWIYIGALLAYVGVLVWIAVGRPPVRPAVLHTAMRVSQGTAAAVGHFGLKAEAAYRRTVNPTGGAQ